VVRNADDWCFIDKTGAKVLGPFGKVIWQGK
jgi:hypothetical protein